MQTLDLKEWEKRLDELTKKMPQRRKELHERAAKRALAEVRAQISIKLNDSHGHVQQMQEASVGSGGGYGKVKAKKGTTGRDSPGAKTNYLENGHAARKPKKQKSQRSNWANKRTAMSKAYVNGRGFYREARKRSTAILMEEGEKMMQEVAKEMGG